MEEETIKDIICSVLAQERTVEVVKTLLNEFLPEYQKLHLDYMDHPDIANYNFSSGEEMIQLCVDRKTLKQTFYWNQRLNNPHRIMVGANFTSDGKLIMSLTFDGNLQDEQEFYLKLKYFLNSTIGVISYINPPPYKDGNDFFQKYQHNKYTFE